MKNTHAGEGGTDSQRHLAQQDWREQPLAVLVSGGIDSCVLVGELAETAPRVVPLYVRCGLQWENVEECQVRRFLAALDRPVIEPLQVFRVPIAQVYGQHWSTTGATVPDQNSADEAVYLPGRNLLLLAPTALWCHLHEIATIALGPLASNPFPDSTDSFFAAYQAVINQAVTGSLRIERPYCQLTKPQVLQRGAAMPLHETFSCICPVGQQHCGRCNKCAERRRGFAAAGLTDGTRYAHDVVAQ